jgi:hypothetical protein
MCVRVFLPSRQLSRPRTIKEGKRFQRDVRLALARLILFSILENWASRRILDLDLSPTNCFISVSRDLDCRFSGSGSNKKRNGMQKEESEAQRKQFSAV